MNIQLNPGSVINNSQLTDIFLCAPQGGMRRSHRTNSLVLISDKTGIYSDRTEGDIFYYTGMGQIGDQKLKGQNKTLAESGENGVKVYFFEVLKKREYTYRGEVVLAGEPFKEKQKDLNNNLRDVWIFPLRLIDNGNVDTQFIHEIQQLEAQLEADTLVDVTEKERIVKTRIGQSIFKSKLLTKSNKCALCDIDDERFLIASHIKPWSKSTNEERLDVNNGLLLCPNHDALFDKGYISFDENGFVQISNELNKKMRNQMNVTITMQLKDLTLKSTYLSWHYHHIYQE